VPYRLIAKTDARSVGDSHRSYYVIKKCIYCVVIFTGPIKYVVKYSLYTVLEILAKHSIATCTAV